MCLTPRQYNTCERLNHIEWKTKIIQKQMTEIMEDLDECVSNGKYTDGEYLALSKEIKMWYETYGKLEKLFTEIQRQIKGQLLDCFARFNGDPVETLDFLCYGELRDPKARARRAKWLRVWQGTPGFEKEYAFTELIVTIYGGNLGRKGVGGGGGGGGNAGVGPHTRFGNTIRRRFEKHRVLRTTARGRSLRYERNVWGLIQYPYTQYTIR